MATPDRQREEKMTAIVRAAGHDNSSVFLADFPAGHEGEHWFTNGVADAFVSRALSEPEAEAVALHELAHVELDHDDDPAYEAARAADAAAGIDRNRGPWEVDAESLAAAMVESVADQMTDAEASLASLAEGAARFP